MPRADIFETEAAIVVVTDMPGVDENTVDVTLEEHVLTISGRVEAMRPEGHSLAYTEYQVGDYLRTFTLSGQIERDGIEATVKDGVLSLHLPKVSEARKRKIAIRAA